MGDYDDDFEDYDEDFEPEPVEVKETKIKPISKVTKTENSSATSKINQSVNVKTKGKDDPRIESKSKEYNDSNSRKSASDSNKYVGKFSSSISLSETIGISPHYRRLKSIYSSNVLDLQEDKFNQLNILPTTIIDLYYRQLKGTGSNSRTTTTETNTVTTLIRQIGVCTREETRDVEVNTDDITYADKEMQFSYGNDETTFLNILRNIQSRGKKGSYSNNTKNEMKDFNKTKSDDVSHIYGTPKLSTFLHKSSILCELILEESRVKAEESSKIKQSKSFDQALDSLAKSVLDHNSSWIKVGPERCGALELIAFRIVNVVAFSPLQPNLVLTAHPYPVDESLVANELKPYTVSLKSNIFIDILFIITLHHI